MIGKRRNREGGGANIASNGGRKIVTLTRSPQQCRSGEVTSKMSQTPQGRFFDVNSNLGENLVFITYCICNVCVEFSFRHLKLTAEQKCDIAQRELEELRDEIEKLKDESEKILDNFRVGQQIIRIKLRENFDIHTSTPFYLL